MHPTNRFKSRAVLPQVTLEITRGRAQHKFRAVHKSVFLIGTAADCDLVLADPRFDAVHSYVYRTAERVTIRHLGTGPELKVNGRIVTSATLEAGAVVQMGSYEFHTRIVWPQGLAAPVEQSQVLSVRHESAIERLMSDVEQQAPPRLCLYVGESEEEPQDRAARVARAKQNLLLAQRAHRA